MSAGRPSLTVCCLAVEPPAQVASVLQLFREVADEVIVAADARRQADELGPYLDVADRVVRYEYDIQPCHARPWLHSQCHGDWIFSIDGDEVPSVALTEALPELIARADVLQYHFPRRWLYRDPGRWLEELPWWPDYHLRLVRTGPTMRHTGRIHEGFRPSFPMRYTDLPIYHLPFLTASVDERRERSERYEAVSPHRVAYGGGGLNQTLNLPEIAARSSGSPVPPEDRARIERVLAERLRPGAQPHQGVDVPLITKAEIDRHVRPVVLAADDYRTLISAHAELGRMAPGETRHVFVRVSNEGSVPWPWGFECEPFVRLGYHWFTADGTRLRDDGPRSPLTSDLLPGESLIVPVEVRAPVSPGRYTLAIDLVHEAVRWFGAPGRIEVVVEADANRPHPRPPVQMVLATVVAGDQRAQARVLAQSFLRRHPDGRVLGLLVDAPDAPDADADAAAEPFEVLVLRDLGIDEVVIHRMAAIYDAPGFALALRPFLLRHLLVDRGLPAVTYLDPATEVFGELDDLELLARRHGIVVTPNRLAGDAVCDDRRPDDRTLTNRGAFDLDYLGVSRASEPFLAEWSARCRKGGLAIDEHRDRDRDRDGEQRTIGEALAAHPHHVLRDPGCAVAHWNADGRPITVGADGYRADGWPLRFFHFSGFDPAVPHLLSRDLGERPRVLLSQAPVLRALVANYADQLAEAGRESDHRRWSRWERTAGGMRLHPVIRRVLRDEADRCDADPFPRSDLGDLPDVFVDDSDRALVAMLAGVRPETGGRGLPRLLEAIYREREDLQRAFPQPRDVDRAAFSHWLDDHGRGEYDLPDELVTALRAAVSQRHLGRPSGGGVVIDVTNDGDAFGATARALRTILADELHERCAIRGGGASLRPGGELCADPLHDGPGDSGASGASGIRLLLLNGQQHAASGESTWPAADPPPYTIGIVAWDLDEVPDTAFADVVLDEIWTYSTQAVAAFRRAVAQPVRHLPASLIAQYAQPAGARRPDTAGRFVFLCRFDPMLRTDRQNVLDVIDAFRRAFAPDEGPVLIVECINARHAVIETERLHAATSDRADVLVIGAHPSPGRDSSAVPACDCFVSLHRSEVKAIDMAQAMSAGVPVIATHHSGNLDFVNDVNAFLVRCRTAPAGSGLSGALWAEPDVDDAARLMRLVRDDPGARDRVGSRARSDMAALHPPGSGVLLLAARLAEARARASVVTAPEPAHRAGAQLGRLAGRAVRGAQRLAVSRRTGSAPSATGDVERPQA